MECAEQWLLERDSSGPYCKQDVTTITDWKNKARVIVPQKRQRVEQDDGSHEILDENDLLEECHLCREDNNVRDFVQCDSCRKNHVRSMLRNA